MNKIKFLWHKYWLRKYYNIQLTMEDSASCGIYLLTYVSSKYTRAKRKVDFHFKRCEELDKEVNK